MLLRPSWYRSGRLLLCPSRCLTERRQTLRNSPKTRLFLGLIPIPAKGFKAVFRHSERLMEPGILPGPRPTKAPGGAIANRPGRTCRKGCRPQRNPGRLSGRPGNFSVVFRAVFGNFSGRFLRKFQRIFAGKSRRKSPESRGIFCEKVAESFAKVAPESRRQESHGSESQSRDQESLAVDSTKVALRSTRYFFSSSSRL